MNPLVQKIATLFIICVFVGNVVTPIVTNAGSFGSFSDQTQENFEKGVVMCAGTAAILMIVSYVAGGFSVPTTPVSDLVKETILDCLFWAFKNAIIQEITGSTVHWVKEGMNGNPAFVQNIGQHLKKVADHAAGDVIEKYIPFVCSPFRADVKLQLALLVKGGPELGRCTLTGSMQNVQKFLGGDFSAGGWEAWQLLFESDQNNPYGAYYAGRSQLMLSVSSASGEAQAKLDLGSGFFSKEVQTCYVYPLNGTEPSGQFDVTTGQDATAAREEAGLAPGSIECDPARIVTPGAQVKNSLEKVLGVNLDQAVTADEFDEIFNLLAVWLLSDILTRDEGLAGYDPANINHELPAAPEGSSSPFDDTPPGPPGPPVCFDRGSVFHTPTQGDETAAFLLNVPDNVSYDRLTLDVDVTHGGWPANVSEAAQLIFWFVRGGNKSQFGYALALAPNANGVRLRHGIGQQQVFKQKAEAGAVLVPGETYHFAYVYDVSAMEITLTVTKENGERVAVLRSVPDVPGINTGTRLFLLNMGFSTGRDSNKELPSYGWDYANLRVVFANEGETPGACTQPTATEPSDGPGNDNVGPGGNGGGGQNPDGGGRPGGTFPQEGIR